jgi:RND family efflux transporter MFP subunit
MMMQTSLRVLACVLALLVGGAACAATVPVTAVRALMWRTEIEVPAQLMAQQSAELAAGTSGIVRAVMFRSGERVAAGQVLVQLVDGPVRAQGALDAARLEQARRELARTQKLMAIAGSSESALEAAQAAVAEASAQLDVDNAMLAQLTIVAPFAGVVGIRRIDPGDYLQAGQAVVALAGQGALRAIFSVPEGDAAGLAVGQEFTLAVPGFAPAAGALTALSPLLNAQSAAREVEGNVQGAGLLAGMDGVAKLATGVPIAAFAVPSSALSDSTLGPYVFAVGADDVISPIYVMIEGNRGADTIVTGPGLSAGLQVVALGGFRLTAGDKITPARPS